MDAVQRIVGSLDAELNELSRLHMAYENAVEWDTEGCDSHEHALALSAAVGKFLVSRGWEGKI